MSKVLELAGASYCASTGLLALPNAVATYNIGADLQICAEGVMAVVAAGTGKTTPQTSPTGEAFTPLTANQACVFLFQYDVNGAPAISQGDIVDVNASGGFDAGNKPLYGEVYDGYVPYGHCTIIAGATAGTFTFGVSNWNATGITTEVKNLGVLPSRA